LKKYDGSAENNNRPKWIMYHESLDDTDMGGKEPMTDKDFIKWIMKRNDRYRNFTYEVDAI
jgi:hypothetical protein